MYVSEIKWDLHDNHSHQNDMAFVDEDKNKEGQKPGGRDTMLYSYEKPLRGLLLARATDNSI